MQCRLPKSISGVLGSKTAEQVCKMNQAHSPDLAPSDFHLFEPLKRHLGDKKFEDEDELIGEVCDWFSKLDANFFTQGRKSMKTPSVSKATKTLTAGSQRARKSFKPTMNASALDESEFATPGPRAKKAKEVGEEIRLDLENLLSECRGPKTPHILGTPKTPKRPLHSIQDPAFTG
ncbi:histone-lysine N-methyltransferase SETMAR [Plakobranchus ocellatus]|uniref:Histone-lysine N-methyltransferase SETMAR n=1 Tax=Plakobranchus ocellatus TaxID=259542 RepID=A0AAV4B7S8_9GAST|nr:histone-lysine N-methyltransferase SETMAR [Plakobranchus ocellatus]